MLRLPIAFDLLLLACLSGCRATPPPSFEALTVRWVKKHITVKGTHQTNPIQTTPQSISDGKHAFGFYCVVCHGRDGQNTGVPFANGVSPPIPSLASAEVQSYSDGQLKWIIENGIAPSGMPASRGILSDDDMWSIVIYLRHLPPEGSLGDPKAYSGEEFEDENRASNKPTGSSSN
ncbi:MAG: c-type cytochrome [Acidobacteria bacterium]|nr:c-type cytochrome [Acidobacteriota bacterium]